MDLQATATPGYTHQLPFHQGTPPPLTTAPGMFGLVTTSRPGAANRHGQPAGRGWRSGHQHRRGPRGRCELHTIGRGGANAAARRTTPYSPCLKVSIWPRIGQWPLVRASRRIMIISDLHQYSTSSTFGTSACTCASLRSHGCLQTPRCSSKCGGTCMLGVQK